MNPDHYWMDPVLISPTVQTYEFKRHLPKFKSEVRDKPLFALDIQEILGSNPYAVTSSFKSDFRSYAASGLFSAEYGRRPDIPQNHLTPRDWGDISAGMGLYANTLTTSEMPAYTHARLLSANTEGIFPTPSGVIDNWLSDLHDQTYESITSWRRTD